MEEEPCRKTTMNLNIMTLWKILFMYKMRTTTEFSTTTITYCSMPKQPIFGNSTKTLKLLNTKFILTQNITTIIWE